MATFWEIVADSVDLMFSLYLLAISRFGFEGWSWVLIASIPELCKLFTSYILSDFSQKNSADLQGTNVKYKLHYG